MFIKLPLDANKVNQPRLTPEEARSIAAFTYKIHDHSAQLPQEPIWWIRFDDKTFES